MKKLLFIVLVFILNIYLVNSTLAAELSERDKLSKIINSSENSYKNVFTPWTNKYNEAKARYDKAISDRDALDKKAETYKKTAKNAKAEKKTVEEAKKGKKATPDPLWKCEIDVDNEIDWLSVKDALDWCLAWSALVDWTEVRIDWNWWFWKKIKNWINNIAIYLWVFAVWSIVLWGLMMTLSSWEDEKIKKAKDIIKWWIIWFIWLISVSAIINLIIKIIYSL